MLFLPYPNVRMSPLSPTSQPNSLSHLYTHSTPEQKITMSCVNYAYPHKNLSTTPFLFLSFSFSHFLYLFTILFGFHQPAPKKRRLPHNPTWPFTTKLSPLFFQRKLRPGAVGVEGLRWNNRSPRVDRRRPLMVGRLALGGDGRRRAC